MLRRIAAGGSALLPFLLTLTGPASAESSGAIPDGWDPPEVLASYDQDFYVAVAGAASDAAGRVYAAWWAVDPDDLDPYLAVVAVRDPQSGDWSEPQKYGDGLHEIGSHFVRLPDGRMLVVFYGTRPDDEDDWRVGFQIVKPDGSLGASRTHQLPRSYHPRRFSPSVSSDGDLVVALLSYDEALWDQPLILHSSALGPFQELPVPAPTLRKREFFTGLLVDPSLHVTAITTRSPRHERLGMIRHLELDDGSWTAHVLARDVTRSPDGMAKGRDGNAALTWNAKDRTMMVGTRIDGTWTVDSMKRTETCAGSRHWDCGIVDIADDGEVIATWLRDASITATSDLMLSRRDPATGEWSRRDAFQRDVYPDARWHLFVGGSGDAIIWWPPGDDEIYQCERGTSCDLLPRRDPNVFPVYADAGGSDVVRIHEKDQVVYASTHHE